MELKFFSKDQLIFVTRNLPGEQSVNGFTSSAFDESDINKLREEILKERGEFYEFHPEYKPQVFPDSNGIRILFTLREKKPTAKKLVDVPLQSHKYD